MKRKKLHPGSPEVVNAALEMLRKMSPEELHAFVTYRTPGIEETDMTGMFGSSIREQDSTETKESVAAS